MRRIITIAAILGLASTLIRLLLHRSQTQDPHSQPGKEDKWPTPRPTEFPDELERETNNRLHGFRSSLNQVHMRIFFACFILLVGTGLAFRSWSLFEAANPAPPPSQSFNGLLTVFVPGDLASAEADFDTSIVGEPTDGIYEPVTAPFPTQQDRVNRVGEIDILPTPKKYSSACIPFVITFTGDARMSQIASLSQEWGRTQQLVSDGEEFAMSMACSKFKRSLTRVMVIKGILDKSSFAVSGFRFTVEPPELQMFTVPPTDLKL